MLNHFNIPTDILQDSLFENKGVKLSVLRLDKIHPIISGNKIFKLNYLLEEAIQKDCKTIVTFGGPYSNHLVATAYTCKLAGLKCVGIVRGEEPLLYSDTLQHCQEYGMQLQFISRILYNEKDTITFIDKLKTDFGNCIIVPEGGYHCLGAKGAAAIMNYIDDSTTHIASAVGTATTVAGILSALKSHQQVIAVPVLKGMTDIPQRLYFLNGKKYESHQLHIVSDYHFGGYAKHTQQLLDSMNQLYNLHKLPTDFVYTGKMMYAIMDMIKHDYFKRGSNIVCVHTGGLQGNLSLQKGILTYN